MDLINLGRISEFGNVRMRSYKVRGRTIGIVRDLDGRFFATEISCKHQLADLSTGTLKGNIVTCPRHGWSYDLATGQCLNQNSACLRRHELRIEAGCFIVSTLPIESEESVDDDPFPEVQLRKRE